MAAAEVDRRRVLAHRAVAQQLDRSIEIEVETVRAGRGATRVAVRTEPV
ncbi:hypothetical protein [Micromonospora halophytica]|uniref:Uncharacterized protein n=1 Tax=Micromonospora halophytica TaxID=47864 RepID=A0A1C5J3H1_9ACTN|nr:hypothetical protein [Micromonospora halophytica]SCG65065.1 hypothetical protein GA0070560_1217 [Micromonospora halophytica]